MVAAPPPPLSLSLGSCLRVLGGVVQLGE
uniref:Uncharacterized protein n=1 Tax=Arundo donax TaxID=35708 RepID=A0A0A9HTM3_ARUDO